MSPDANETSRMDDLKPKQLDKEAEHLKGGLSPIDGKKPPLSPIDGSK